MKTGEFATCPATTTTTTIYIYVFTYNYMIIVSSILLIATRMGVHQALPSGVSNASLIYMLKQRSNKTDTRL